jgi:ribonuclease P protein component
MKTSKCNLSIACGVALVAIILALPGQLPSQTAAAKSSGGNGTSPTDWSVQVNQVDSGNLDLAYSFQIAIYENLVEELNKTKQFKQVFRDGDRKASEVPNLLVLKTTVEKYTQGSETRRAVTTVSGATKLAVRSQLITREGKVVLERTVNGDVRFFGSNLRATHNLARNIAKTIKQSSWSGSGQPTAILTGQL